MVTQLPEDIASINITGSSINITESEVATGVHVGNI